MQHELLSRSSEYIDILYQLVHRTQAAVRLMDNQSYKRLQKMLMQGTSSIEEDDREEDIESEPPRYLWVISVELPRHVALFSEGPLLIKEAGLVI